MNRASVQLSISSNLARILCEIFLQQPKRDRNAQTCKEVCKAWSSTQPPGVSTPPHCKKYRGWCVQKNTSVQSLIANCVREHRCMQALCFGHLFFPYLPSPSPTSQRLKWGLQPGFEMRSTEKRRPGWSGMEDAAVGARARRGRHPPRRPQGGAVALLRAARACRGGGEGGKYTVAKRWWKGKGRFYKFLNFMTMPQQCNVHSICCEVSTENMHWAY